MRPFRFSRLWLALSALGLLAAAAPAAAEAPALRPYAKAVLPDDVVPTRYELRVSPDAKALRFTGEAAIAVEVRRATSRIVLNAADLDIRGAQFDGRPVLGVDLDPERQTASFRLAGPAAPGPHVLNVSYAGKIFQQASGLFALDYASRDGAPERALFTQFENSDARRFLPCWDEPSRKAVFQLTVDAPAALMAVSNMPAASTRDLPGGLKEVAFAPTPKMSSYLLFLGLGDFSRVHREVNGVDVGVVAPKGDETRSAYALDAAAQILPYYNDYFGVNYPLPKLDLIAGPGTSQFFGAMENWGAIFFFDRDLLIDPRLSTPGDRKGVYSVVAHEMAHQWFGDLVTMAWWDDLWLNEGFASWMENKVADHFHPEWRVWLSEQNGKLAAMRLDAKAGTHPIITPVRDVLQAAGSFDTITYQKGEAVIRMLEAYAGETAWRDGVRRYMAAHAYGNTTTDQLWSEIDAVSPRKITAIAHDFTLQAGVPLIRVAPAPGGYSLTEGRWGLDAADRAPRAWRVPVREEILGRLDQEEIVTPARPGRIRGAGPLVANVGQTGYFLSAYAPAAFEKLKVATPRLEAADQLGLTDDAYALGASGYAPFSQFLDVVVRLPASADPLVLQAAAVRLAQLERAFAGTSGEAAYQRFVRRTLTPVLARTGWRARLEEPVNDADLRSAVLLALSGADDPGVVAQARSLFQQMLSDPAALDAATRRTVLAIVAAHADPAIWEALHGLARAARTPLEREEYYYLLGQAQDPKLASAALDLALSDELEPTLRPAMISSVANRHPDLAFTFAADHWSALEPLLEPTSRAGFAPHLLSSSFDPRMIAALDAFASQHVPPSARRDVEQAQSQIRVNAALRADRLPEIARWLAEARLGGES